MRSMIRLWHRTVICLVFVISPKFNFCFLPQTILKERSVQGSLESRKTGECFGCSVQHKSIIPPWPSSSFTFAWDGSVPVFLLTAEQNRYCAILQGSSKKQKIHRLSSVWRASFWICGLDSLGITLGMNEWMLQAREIMFFIFFVPFHDWWCYSLVPTG